MVWEEALSKLAPKLGLSDVGLRKTCKRHNIPLPPQGYWARSPGRRSPKRTPLPQPDKDWDIEFTIPLQATPEGQSELDEKFGPQIAAESLPENQIVVVAKQEPRHPMAKTVAKCLEKARPDQYGAITCAIPAAFRVRVPRESIDRALGIIDALAAAFDVRGLAIDKGAENGSAGVRVGGQLLRLSLEETSSRQVHRATEAERDAIRRRGYPAQPGNRSEHERLQCPANWCCGNRPAVRGVGAGICPVRALNPEHSPHQERLQLRRAGHERHGASVRIPTQASQRFRSIPAGDSDGSQPLIPSHSSHP